MPGNSDDIAAITDVRAGPAGTVSIKVADYDPKDPPAAVAQYQWRDYGLTAASVGKPDPRS